MEYLSFLFSVLVFGCNSKPVNHTNAVIFKYCAKAIFDFENMTFNIDRLNN